MLLGQEATSSEDATRWRPSQVIASRLEAIATRNKKILVARTLVGGGHHKYVGGHRY